ncbi:hypothetical protein CRYUN_Cryun23aG0022400 [Craigia yunnanensis]
MGSGSLERARSSRTPLYNLIFNTDIYNVNPMEGSYLGVRKGAWTEEEDILLKKCIEKYGEGKWHQVPSRAGLNRCRKSCRLRWLNYLRPNIKRGDFADDEVGLIIRLHKLLGNRWSLIAGRLPGRTANDVKNYWNTHLLKKFNPSNKDLKPKPHQYPSKPKIDVIKPRPRTLSKNYFPVRLDGNNKNNNAPAPASTKSVLTNSCNNSSYCIPSDKDETMWWESLLMSDNEVDDQRWESLLMSDNEVDDQRWESLLMNDNEVDDQQQGSFNNSNLSGLGD